MVVCILKIVSNRFRDTKIICTDNITNIISAENLQKYSTGYIRANL